MSARPGLAVVTGASSGIGLAFAERLAADGHPLLLVARREERLRDISARLGSEHGVDVAFVAADLATAQGRAACRDAVDVADRHVDTVVLNAGFGAGGAVAAVGRERQVEMVALNCEAVVDLACHVLPGLIARGAGTLIVVSSAAAYQPIPYTATYAATKAFELYFAEALATELAGTGVRVIAACPGPTSTEFGRVAGVSAGPRWMPRETAGGVVSATFRALERGRPRVATGALSRTTSLLAALLPRRLIVWGAGVLHRKFASERPH